MFMFRNCLLLLKNRLSKSWYVKIGLHQLDVNPGIKVNVACYRNKLLLEWLLPTVRLVSGKFIFRQDTGPAHMACDTVCGIEWLISSDLWSLNSPDLNPVDKNLGCNAVAHLPDKSLKWSGLTCSWASLTMLLTSGSISTPVFEPEEDILSMHCDLRTILVNDAD